MGYKTSVADIVGLSPLV